MGTSSIELLTRLLCLRRLRLAALLLLISGCQAATFQPVDAPPSAVDPSLAAARRTLRSDGDVLGEVEVWSEAIHSKLGEPNILRLRMRIQNADSEPMRLDLDGSALQLQTSSDRVVLLPVAEIVGSPSVPPGGARRLRLEFRIPSSVELWDVAGFNLVWTVVTARARVPGSAQFVRAPRWRRHEDPLWGGYPGPLWERRAGCPLELERRH